MLQLDNLVVAFFETGSVAILINPINFNRYRKKRSNLVYSEANFKYPLCHLNFLGFNNLWKLSPAIIRRKRSEVFIAKSRVIMEYNFA